ncbi:MAG: flippase [Candidatus Heimdallarchaeaceae archaeon]
MDEERILYEKYLKTSSKQAGMVFGTKVIGYLLGFAMQAVFARFLGVDKYGLYSLGLTVANVGALFGTFGLNTGMTRFLGEYLGKEEFSKAKGTIFSGFEYGILFSLIPTIAILIFRKPIAVNVFHDERLIPLLPWFSVILMLLTLMNLLKGMIEGFKKPSVFTFNKEIIERVFRITLFIVLFFFGIEVIGIVFATLFSSLIVVIILIIWLFKRASFLMDKRIKAATEKKLLSYSSNMLFVSFTYFLMGQVNRMIIGGFLDSKQVGLYSISDTIAHLGIFFLVAFNSIFAPIISELFHQNKKNILSLLYSNITRWVATLTLPLVIWMIIFSEDILIIFGKEFILAKWVLIIIAIGQYVSSLAGATGLLLRMTKYQKLEMINGIFVASMNIGLNLWLIPKMGIMGSAIASASTVIAINLIKLLEVFILLKLIPYNKLFLKLLLPAAITVIAMLSLSLVIQGLLAAFVGLFGCYVTFMLMLLLLKLQPEDKMIIKAVINRFKH